MIKLSVHPLLLELFMFIDFVCMVLCYKAVMINSQVLFTVCFLVILISASAFSSIYLNDYFYLKYYLNEECDKHE